LNLPLRGADRALEKGSVDELARMISAEVAGGLRQRFERAHRARQSAESSVSAGREYVEAYVELMHYVEQLHVAARGHEDSVH
jgi:hypothetical protein